MLRAGLLATAASLFGSTAFAASSGVQHFVVQGSGRSLASGDFVSHNGAPGLNTYYSFFIEVPPGLASLRVQVFDADTGNGLDVQSGGSFNTSTRYTLLRPNGTTAAGPYTVGSANNCGTGFGNNCNNQWRTIGQTAQANPAAGHWELRVDASSAVTGGDDNNFFGVRADDGDSSSGGTELPIYLHSYFETGVQANGAGQVYNLFTHVTRGCSWGFSNFDGDDDQGDGGSVVTTSRTGAFTQSTGAISSDNAWQSVNLTGWTTPSQAVDYGLWPITMTVRRFDQTTPQNNYVTLYSRSTGAANPPPTAQPEANTFRMYLRTDGGAAPVKPWVEQHGRWMAGPNPPIVGQTTRIRNVVRVTNPTARAITFSATNVVTARVPGSGVVYAGNPLTSAGTILSAPALGGTGDLVWNPGTVAAGTSVAMQWDVEVTPTTAGQTLNLTGTEFANGTTAVYVDETGNTTQGRATMTFGPLCQLSVTEGVITHATIAEVELVADARGRAELRFATGSEAGSVGFWVWRRAEGRWTRLHDAPIVAMHDAPQGGRYRLLDPGVEPGRAYEYTIVEVDRSGRESPHGPYTLELGRGRDEALLEPGEVERVPHARTPPPPRPPPADRLASLRIAPLLARRAADAIRIGVSETGVHRIPQVELAAAFGRTVEDVDGRLRNVKLALTRAGRPIAYHRDRDGLWFYGEASTSPFGAEAIYHLSLGPGLLVERRDGRVEAPSVSTHVETVTLAEDLFAGTVVAPDPAKDFWFWKVLSPSSPTLRRFSTALVLPDVIPSEPGEVELALHGATSAAAPVDHAIDVSLNGAWIGRVEGDGVAPFVGRIAVPPNTFLASGNTLELSAVLPPGVASSVAYLDRVTVRFTRPLAAGSGPLSVDVPDAASLTVTTDAAKLVVWDVSDPERPVGVQPDRSQAGVLRFGAEAAARYQLFPNDRTLAPSLLEPRPAVPATARPARFAILAHRSLLSAAERLAARRRAEGLTPEVIDVSDVYDELSGGIPDPAAIAAFVAAGRARATERLEYVLLAGAGTYDYKDALGYGTSLVPPRMIRTPEGLYASDPALADVDGDGLPDVAIGRIPARTPAELEAAIAKLERAEATGPSAFGDQVLLVADKRDGQTSFATTLPDVAAALAERRVETLDLTGRSVASARGAVLGRLRAGVGLVGFVGHGGLDRLGKDGVLRASDAPTLLNPDPLPVLAAMSCAVSRFEVPGVAVFGPELLLQPSGGFIAVLAPTGPSVDAEARPLLAALARELSRGPGRLGDAVLRSSRSFALGTAAPHLVELYGLLGDPTHPLRSPSPPATTPRDTCTEDGNCTASQAALTAVEPPLSCRHARPSTGAPLLLLLLGLAALARRRR